MRGNLTNHDFVGGVFYNLLWITCNNGWRDYYSTVWVSESNNLTEWVQLERKRQGIKKLLNAHGLGYENLNICLSKFSFERKVHILIWIN